MRLIHAIKVMQVIQATLKHPLILFLISVFVLEWVVVLALLPLSPAVVGLIALVPTPVALIVAATEQGRKGAARLIRRSLVWRLSLKWYALAIIIPVAISLVTAVVALSAGATLTPRPEALLAYLPLTLLLAVGEEIGWQGYAMPRIRVIFSTLLSVIVFGMLHAAFHLPMYLLPLPDEMRQASPFPLFLLMVTAFAVYRVWFYEHTNGNVPQIIVFHMAINTSVLLLAGAETALLGWLLPAIWVLAALPLLATKTLREGPTVATVPDSASLQQS